MSKFLETKLGRAVESYVKVFLAVVLGLFLADGADLFAVDATDLKTWLFSQRQFVLFLWKSKEQIACMRKNHLLIFA